MLFQMDGRRGELGTKKKLFVDWGLGESQPVTPASAWNSRSRNIASSSRFVFSLGVCETLSNNRLHHRPIIMDSRQQTCIKSDGKWKKDRRLVVCVIPPVPNHFRLSLFFLIRARRMIHSMHATHFSVHTQSSSFDQNTSAVRESWAEKNFPNFIIALNI